MSYQMEHFIKHTSPGLGYPNCSITRPVRNGQMAELEIPHLGSRAEHVEFLRINLMQAVDGLLANSFNIAYCNIKYYLHVHGRASDLTTIWPEVMLLLPDEYKFEGFFTFIQALEEEGLLEIEDSSVSSSSDHPAFSDDESFTLELADESDSDDETVPYGTYFPTSKKRSTFKKGHDIEDSGGSKKTDKIEKRQENKISNGVHCSFIDKWGDLKFSITAFDELFDETLTGLYFNGHQSFGGIDIPEFLRKIEFKHVKRLLSSLVKLKLDHPDTQQKADLLRQFKLDVDYCLHNFDKEEGIVPTRSLLMQVTQLVDLEDKVKTLNYSEAAHQFFKPHSVLIFPDLPQTLFDDGGGRKLTKKEKKGKIDENLTGYLYYSNDLGVLGPLLTEVRTSKMLHPHKIKGMINSIKEQVHSAKDQVFTNGELMLKARKEQEAVDKGKERTPKVLDITPDQSVAMTSTLDKVKKFFTSKMTTIHENDWKDGRLFVKLSWLVPYLPPKFYHIHCASHQIPSFLSALNKLIIQFRHIMISWIEQYFNVGQLEKGERQQFKVMRRETFKNILRTPEIQIMYVNGMSHHQICEHVNKKFRSVLDNSGASGQLLLESVQQQKTVSKKSIQRARDLKYADDYEEWEPTSLTYAINALAPIWVPAVTVGLLSFIFTNAAAKDAIGSVKQLADDAKPVVSKTESLLDKLNGMLDNMGSWLSNPSKIDPEIKLMLVDIKTVCHVIYELNFGTQANAIKFATYIPLTRPEIFLHMIGTVTKFIRNERTMRMSYGETQFEFPLNYYPYVMSTPRSKWKEVFPQCVVTHETNSDPFISKASKFLANFTTFSASKESLHMSEQNIRNANARMQYIFNTSKLHETWANSTFSILSTMSTILLGFDFTDTQIQSYSFQLMQFVKSVDSLELCFEESIKSAEGRERVAEMVRFARLIYDDAHYMLVPSIMQHAFNERYARLRKWAAEAAIKNRSAKHRRTPLCVLFTGPPGVGKTKCTRFLIQSMLSFDGIILDDTMIYPFDSATEYWEGYCQQYAVTIDDLFKSLDVTIRNREGSAVLNMVNDCQYSLNMAFGTKGYNFFDSKLVVMSTNLMNDGFDSSVLNIGMTDPDAIKRRVHVAIHREVAFCGEAHANTFRIDKIPEQFNQYKDKVYDMVDISRICKLVQDWMNEREDQGEYTPDRIKELYIQRRMNPIQESQEVVTIPESERNVVSDKKKKKTKPSQTHEPTSGSADAFGPDFDPWGERDLIPGNMSEPDFVLKGTSDEEEEDLKLPPRRGEMLRKLPVVQVNPMVYLKTFVELFSSKIGPYIPYITAFFMAGLAYVYSEQIKSTLFPDTFEESSAERSRKARRSNRYKIDPKSTRKFRRFKREFEANFKKTHVPTSDDGYYKNLLTASKGSVYIVGEIWEEDQIVRSDTCVGFHLKDGLICTAAHFLLPYLESEEIRIKITWTGGEIEMGFPEDVYVTDQDDLVVFRMTSGQRPKALYKYLMKAESAEVIEPGARLNHVMVDENGAPIIRNLFKSVKDGPISYSKDGNQFIVDEPLGYVGPVKKGDSGGLVAKRSKEGNLEIVGMHVTMVKGQDKGAAVPLCKEYIDELLAAEEVIKHTADFKDEETYESCSRNTLPIAVVRQIHPPNIPPHKSKIKDSVMHGFFGLPKCIPARLSPFKGKDPIQIALKKVVQVKREGPPFDEQKLIETMLYHYPPPIEPLPILTMEQALNGGYMNMQPLILGTSAGYPYNTAGYKGKTDLIEEIDGVRKPVAFFEKILKDQENQMLQGIRPDFLFADNLKDETRPRKKVLQGKTRLFSAGPIDLTLHARRYTGAFFQYVMQDPVDKPIAVGINVHSRQWQRLRARLTRFSDNVVSSDFEGYDGNLPSYLDPVIFKIMRYYYRSDTPEQVRVREIILINNTNSFHVLYDQVYEVQEGNATGQANTAGWNSYKTCLMWTIVLHEDFGMSVDDYELAIYGDDSVVALRNSSITWKDLAPHFKRRFNMNLTHWSKGQIDARIDSIDEIRFLGRKFYKNDYYIRAPLDIYTVAEILYWTRGDQDDLQLFLSSVDSFLIELSHHGRKAYQAGVACAVKALTKRKPEWVKFFQWKAKPFDYYQNGMYQTGHTIYFGYGDERKSFDIKQITSAENLLDSI